MNDLNIFTIDVTIFRNRIRKLKEILKFLPQGNDKCFWKEKKCKKETGRDNKKKSTVSFCMHLTGGQRTRWLAQSVASS